MMTRHQQMANQMMENFGMGSMLKKFRDPFANDPFFKEPFGQIDKMITRMRDDIKQQMAEPISMNTGGMSKGRFAKMQMITSTKTDARGNPVTETYQSKA